MTTDKKTRNIADYLHLYLGCNVLANDPNEPGPVQMVAVNTESIFIDSGCDYLHADVTLILRPLDSMTEEEIRELFKIPNDWTYQLTFSSGPNTYSYIECWKPHDLDSMVTIRLDMFTAEQFNWLRKNFFDVDELIPDGLAISSTQPSHP